MITDEQVKIAANRYLSRPIDSYLLNGNLTDMRKALEAYEQSKWVRFDNYLPDDPNKEVLFCICGEEDLQKYGMTEPRFSVDILVDAGAYVLAVHQDEAIFDKSKAYWQHLPECKK